MSMNIQVICYAGYKADEEPVYFYQGTRKITVEEVADSWTGEEHRYFEVKGDDGSVYTLRQDTQKDIWELTMYDRGGGR